MLSFWVRCHVIQLQLWPNRKRTYRVFLDVAHQVPHEVNKVRRLHIVISGPIRDFDSGYIIWGSAHKK